MVAAQITLKMNTFKVTWRTMQSWKLNMDKMMRILKNKEIT